MSLNRSVVPPIQSISPIPLTQMSHQQFSNGLSFHFIKGGNQPILRLEFIYQIQQNDKANIAVYNLLIKMLQEGTSKYTTSEIHEIFEHWGAFVDFKSSFDRLNLTIYVLAKYLKQILPLLKSLMDDSVFPNQQFEIQKNLTYQNLTVNLTKTQYVASQLFREKIFGQDSRYGKRLTLENLEEISRKDVFETYQSIIQNKPFDIILAGQVENEHIQLLESFFGQQTFTHSLGDIPSEEAIYQQVTGKYYQEKEGALQSSIRIGKVLFDKKHPDFFDFMVLNTILGGYFGSRLMQNIREDKGYTYGINSQNAVLENIGYWVIGTDVKQEFTDQTLEEIYKEIQLLQSELVSHEELEKVKNYLMGAWVRGIVTPFDLADKFKAIHYHGLDYSFYTQYWESIQNITSERIMQIAQKHLKIESLTEVIVGKK